jgi:hypothetical protein
MDQKHAETWYGGLGQGGVDGRIKVWKHVT